MGLSQKKIYNPTRIEEVILYNSNLNLQELQSLYKHYLRWARFDNESLETRIRYIKSAILFAEEIKRRMENKG